MKTVLIKTVLLIALTMYFLPIWVSAEQFDSFYYTVTDDNTVTITHRPSSATEIIIPAKIDGFNVTAIAEGTFICNYSLKRIVISNGIISIGNCVFEDNTSLEHITIPNSVTSIGRHAFYGCRSLSSIILPRSLTSISNAMFCNCTSLQSITLPDSVTHIDDYAFCNCTKLKKIIIPDNVTSIGLGSFADCSDLTSVTLGNKVASIEWSTFSDCNSLTTVSIPKNVTEIKGNAFKNCFAITTVEYGGTAADWAKISIASGNDCLKNATINCTDKTIQKTITYTPRNIPIDSTIIIGCYAKNVLVDIYMIPYDGSEIVTYTPDVAYDSAKVLVLKDLQSLVPVCNM